MVFVLFARNFYNTFLAQTCYGKEEGRCDQWVKGAGDRRFRLLKF